MAFLMSAEGAAMTVALVLEFVFRMIPSEKPLSVLHLAAGIMKKAGAILSKAGDLLDKILPQKIAAPKE